MCKDYLNLFQNLPKKLFKVVLRSVTCFRFSFSLETASNAETLQAHQHAIGNKSVPIQLAESCFPGLAIFSAKIVIHFSAEAILSNSTEKLVWFEITKMLIAVYKINFTVIYHNFWHTFIPYRHLQLGKR